MRITVNGEPREVRAGTRVSAFAEHPDGMAVALNGLVLPAAAWGRTTLRDGDAVEIVTAMQGG